uniref:DUF1508 domain-containing protein n=1 Tax=Heterorhabditis bacteriophora TaxID=37862 RepID=A0A1I7WQK0_HETBA
MPQYFHIYKEQSGHIQWEKKNSRQHRSGDEITTYQSRTNEEVVSDWIEKTTEQYLHICTIDYIHN